LERLVKRAQFLHVRGGLRAPGAHVLIEARRHAPGGPIGVGFTATKKIGGAVVRNRARRRLKEAARRLLPEFGLPGVDYVFVARQSAPDTPWAALLDDVRNALIRLRADFTSGRDSQPRKGGRRAPKPSTESD
jgi:ribonuclease P protein component